MQDTGQTNLGRESGILYTAQEPDIAFLVAYGGGGSRTRDYIAYVRSSEWRESWEEKKVSGSKPEFLEYC
jgi:hypothetical protein